MAAALPISFADMAGWSADDLRKAAPGRSRADIESSLQPYLVSADPTWFTGYFEPEYEGGLTRTLSARFPVYASPDDPSEFDRRAIDLGALAGRGLELAWLTSASDAFFLQVQGSGRIRLPDGGTLRLGYAAKNGRDYTSVGKALVAMGAAAKETISAEVIRNYVEADPERGQALLWQNESYVFFRALPDLPSEVGPIGTFGKSLTAGRSLAVDPDVIPLGTLVWVEVDAPTPICRLMVAEDTGSAIKGAGRADIFFGTGPQAGQMASDFHWPGRMIALFAKNPR